MLGAWRWPFSTSALRPAAWSGGARGLFGKSREERRREREELFQEIGRGYFGDFHEFRRTGGKRLEAPDHLCTRKEGVLFPAVSGRSLAGERVELPGVLRGHVALVLLSFRALGMRMGRLYLTPFSAEFGSNAQVKVFEVTVVDRVFFRLFRRWIERRLRREVPTERHMSFMLFTGGRTGEVKRVLRVGNSIVGHAYLLDQRGVVRWHAHAIPTTRELQALSKCTRQLLEQNRK